MHDPVAHGMGRAEWSGAQQSGAIRLIRLVRLVRGLGVLGVLSS